MKTSALKRNTVIALLLVSAATLVGPSAHAAATRYITISAEGTVKVVPDAVRVSATISHVSATSKDALAAVAKSSNIVRTALKTAKVDSKDISTQSVTTYPEYKYSADGTSTQIGYRASQTFSIVIRSAAGDVVDALVVAVADDLQINATTPFVLDASKSTVAARAVAVKNAKAKAISYASLLGVKLGRINYLVENSSPQISTPVLAMAKAESDSTVVDLGQQDVTVSITIQWSLL